MNTFPKSSRLKGHKKLQLLFSRGKSIRSKDIRLVYMMKDATPAEIKCGVGVSAKIFKKAVDRNRIKRLLRESYRLQQLSLTEIVISHNKQLACFILFTGKDLPDYKFVFENVGVVLQKLVLVIHANSIKNT